MMTMTIGTQPPCVYAHRLQFNEKSLKMSKTTNKKKIIVLKKREQRLLFFSIFFATFNV